ncbi:MAG: RNA polymerase sigma factor SigZ, partial [candidate division Zixibacteria bacterium]|nr:RNA polymerase sigma factor SigZ [candidate division Zixibacteria bacterium]
DMVQDIFLRVHERMGSVRDTGRIESWLFQIACNAIVDHYRRNRAGEPVPDWI